MRKRIYVGNLPHDVLEEDLSELFSEHGTVHAVELAIDPDSGKPLGFGYIEMDEGDAGAAIEALDGATLRDRNLRVDAPEDAGGPTLGHLGLDERPLGERRPRSRTQEERLEERRRNERRRVRQPRRDSKQSGRR